MDKARDNKQSSVDTQHSSHCVAPDAKDDETAQACSANDGKAVEIGGPTGPEPTRYGDWEKKGRCIDF